MATATDTRLFGKSIKRREDPRFITGRGNYTDDLKLPGMTYAAFVRSPHAHAKIRKIDVAKAKAHPGVVAIFTGKDLTGVNSLPCGWLLPDLKVPPHPPLAVDTVRYVGDPVAIVIAESQDAALDAAEKLKVDWEIRPAVTATAKAADRGAAQIHEVAPSNVAFKWQIGDAAAVDAAVTSAAGVGKKAIDNQRPVAHAIEPRAGVARNHATDVELALPRDGKILGLRVKPVANMGAYLSTFAPAVPTYLYGTLLNGVYEIGAIHADVTGVFTNTTPVDAYRGAGRPEAAYLLERMIEAGAAALKTDVTEIRKKNFIPKFEHGYQTKVALTYDSGNYSAAFDKLLTMFDYKKFRTEQEAARKQGKLIGVGFSTYIEACSIAPSKVVGSLGAQAGLYESAIVRVHPTGKVTVFTGSHSHGQGHETTFSQLVADHLSIPIDDVEIVHGDTGAIAFGMGTYGSRSASVGGTAIAMSIAKIKEKGKKIAAHLLEASPGDMEYVNGQFQVKGFPGKAVPFGQVALTAYVPHKYPEGLEPGLEETSFYDPSNFCFPFGAHACVVEVDRDTGKVKILRYLAVDDVGNVINPMIVDGMVHGGITQGVGQALWEGAVYDDGSGQLVTGTMMDYALPKADMLTMYETDRTVTPTLVNPLGIKGAGETGTIAATPAVVNAVVDALRPLGVDHIETMPLSPERVWKTIQSAKTAGAAGPKR